MQRGLSGYAGVTDTFLDNYLRTTVRGAMNPLYLDGTNYRPLLRFAIFQSEGGPVPNGATIQSAKLELYKQYYDDTLRLNALLKPWVESQATWQLSQTGVAWSVAGAAGSGTDFDATVDAQVAAGFNPGLGDVRRDSARAAVVNGAGTNYGWRMVQTISRIQFQDVQFERVCHRHHAATQAHRRVQIAPVVSTGVTKRACSRRCVRNRR